MESDSLDPAGFVVDFERIQPHLAGLAEQLDHRLLNELEMFQGATPSAERQAEFFYQRLGAIVEREFGSSVRVAKVKVIQLPDAWAEYEP